MVIHGDERKKRKKDGRGDVDAGWRLEIALPASAQKVSVELIF